MVDTVRKCVSVIIRNLATTLVENVSARKGTLVTHAQSFALLVHMVMDANSDVNVV